MLRESGGERGVVLITALLVMVFLLPLGAVFLKVALTESLIASNEVSAARTFHLGEAGIQHAQKALESLDLSDVLAGTTSIFPGGNTASLAGGTYTVQVTNNIAANGFPRGTIPADAGGSPTVDVDRILVVTSTGSFANAQKVVEAIVQVPLPLVISGAARLMDGPGSGERVAIEDLKADPLISGNDCNPPSAGGGPGPGPDLPGISVENATAQSDLLSDIDDPADVIGVNGDGDVQVVPGGMSATELQALVASLMAVGTPIGTAPCDGGTYGTPASPQVCYGSSDLADSTGAGILIFTDDVELSDFVYEGIIIVVGNGRLRLLRDSRLYGAVIQKNYLGGHSGETRLRMEDDSNICYSSAAVQTAIANNAAGGGQTMAWYEL
ncbi:MAG: hypothetical protein ACE5MG_14445 [Candidatus Methylomirabilales bacterium]